MFDTCDPLERNPNVVGSDRCSGRPYLVEKQLEPQLAGLVLNDEQEFVVVFRLAHRVLRIQEGVESEVGPVTHLPGKIGDDVVFDVSCAVRCRHLRSPCQNFAGV